MGSGKRSVRLHEDQVKVLEEIKEKHGYRSIAVALDHVFDERGGVEINEREGKEVLRELKREVVEELRQEMKAGY